jgi:phosphorylcholine metabolism protein LicD
MCNKDTKKCDTKKGEMLNDCCKRNLIELLEIIDIIFEKHNILYWIDYGTLLGATRNKDIIPYDDDGDIGILRQDLDRLLSLSNEFRLLGYDLCCWFYPDFLRLDFSRMNELHVDIFVWDIQRMPFKELWQDESMQREMTCLYRQKYIDDKDENKGKHFPIRYLFPLEKIKFNRMELFAPNNPERFSMFRYGLDWKKEIREN